jgi:transcriptional regulator with XRE-family HTH domain
MSNILSAVEAKQARASIKRSQGKVASELGLNRTYLSLFEGGKYLFDDGTLQRLRAYYEERDCSFGVDDKNIDGVEVEVEVGVGGLEVPFEGV